MNHYFRSLWSEARGAYIVAHENAAARGKPSSARKATRRTNISFLTDAHQSLRGPGTIPDSLRRKPLAVLCTISALACASVLFATDAFAIDVANQADWNTAVAAVSTAGANSTVTINVTGGFTLTGSLAQLQASNTNVTVNITGNGKTIDGASSYQGIQVNGSNALTVNISNLTVANTKAIGGNGQNGQNGYYSGGLAYGSGGGGGGGLGAGGGLLVGSGANVSLSSVTFTGNAAQGGAGGNGGSAQNTAADPVNGGNGGAGGAANNGGASGGGGAGGTGGHAGTRGTSGAAGASLGDGGGGGGGSGTTNSTTYTPNNAGGAGNANGANGGSGGDGATNASGSGGPGPGSDGGAGGNGGSANGGAIYVATGGTLTLLDTPISGTRVTGGAAGTAGTGRGPSSINGFSASAGAAQGSALFISGAMANIGVSAGTQTYAETIGGTGLTTGGVTTAINKTGAGTLVLSAANTFTGNVNISAGTLSVAGTANLGNVANDVAMSNGATLAVTGTTTFATGRAFSISGASTIDVAGSQTATLQGVIANGASAGSLVKSGAGTLLLTGANTYTGATTVNAGTLRAGSAGALPSGTALTVGAGGTFDMGGFAGRFGSLNGAGTVTNGGAAAAALSVGSDNTNSAFTGSIQNGTGAVSLTKIGTGTLSLGGTNTYSGTTTVNSGALLVNGSIASAVTVNAGGTLGGNGSISNDVSIRPGGTFVTTVANASSYSKLTVGGTATLAGNLFVDAASATGLNASDTPSSIIHANAISGTFSSITDNSALFDFTASYTATDVNLGVKATSRTGVYQAVRNTGDTPATGASRVLDSIIFANPSGAIAKLFEPLASERAVSDAVDQTLPLLIGGSIAAAQSSMGQVSRIIQARQDGVSGLSSGDVVLSDKEMWIKPFGSWADQHDRDGVSGYSASTGGIVFGADAAISPISRLGFAFAYANSSVTGNSSTAPNSATVNVYQLLGYGSHKLDANTELTYQLGLGQNSTRGRRTISFASGTADASYHSLTATAGLGLEKTFAINERASFLPSLRADYSWIKDEAYRETGSASVSPLLLDVASRSSDELILSVNGKINYKLDDSTTVDVNAGLGYDAINDNGSIVAAYAGAPGASFATYGMEQSPWLARGGLGLVHKTQGGMEINVRYDADYRTSFLNHSASIKASWAF